MLREMMSKDIIVLDPIIMSTSTSASSTARSSMQLSWRSHQSSLSSLSSRTSFGSLRSKTTLTPPPDQSPQSRRASPPGALKADNRAEVLFTNPPAKVVDGILKYLQLAHLEEGPIGYVNDLRSLSLTCRSWDRAVTKHLYHTIWITPADYQPQARRLFTKSRPRLKLLRRTLRERTPLARRVRTIHVVDWLLGTNANDETRASFLDALASMVMSCPNLECLTGIYPSYNHDFSRLTHALSTRETLRSHVWLIGPNAGMWNDEKLQIDSRYLQPSLGPAQVDHFVNLHAKWHSLETLVLSCAANGILDHERSFFATFKNLPALKNLLLSGFSTYDFNDRHLAALPRTLKSLRLENMPGISEDGLMNYFTYTLTLDDRGHMQNLSFINTNLQSLPNLSSLLRHLYNLRRLTVLTKSLMLPPHVDLNQILHPFFSSRSLEHLHFQIHSSACIAAHILLAESIRLVGFPSLRTLRAPIDPFGSLQSVCQPFMRTIASDPNTFCGDNQDKCFNCSLRSTNPLYQQCIRSSLSHARERAYDRAVHGITTTSSRRNFNGRAAWHHPLDVVYEEGPERMNSGELDEVEKPLFMGMVGKGVPEYFLKPEVEGSDAGLAFVEDLIRRSGPRFWTVDRGEDEKGKEGRKMKMEWEGEKWWRFQSLPLERFF